MYDKAAGIYISLYLIAAKVFYVTTFRSVSLRVLDVEYFVLVLESCPRHGKEQNVSTDNFLLFCCHFETVRVKISYAKIEGALIFGFSFTSQSRTSSSIHWRHCWDF